eukprot:13109356-Alexandrium_andersonii.AAC.1
MGDGAFTHEGAPKVMLSDQGLGEGGPASLARRRGHGADANARCSALVVVVLAGLCPARSTTCEQDPLGLRGGRLLCHREPPKFAFLVVAARRGPLSFPRRPGRGLRRLRVRRQAVQAPVVPGELCGCSGRSEGARRAPRA